MSVHVGIIAPDRTPAIGEMSSCLEVYVRALIDAGVGVHLLAGAPMALAAQIADLADDGRIDVLHAWSTEAYLGSAVALASRRTRRVPLVVTPNPPRSDGTPAVNFDVICEMSGRGVDGVIELYGGTGPQARAVVELPPLVAPEFFLGDRARGRRDAGLDDADLLLCCSSQIAPHNGQLDLLTAMRLLPAEIAERMTLVVTGGVPATPTDYLAHVERASADCGVLVEFRLETPRERMPDLVAAADIVVLPRRGGGVGVAALEAMAAGVPLVVTAVPCFDRLIEHGRTALQVPPADPRAMAAAIALLAHDPGLRTALATAARDHVRSGQSPQRAAAAALQLYGAITDRASRHDCCSSDARQGIALPMTRVIS